MQRAPRTRILSKKDIENRKRNQWNLGYKKRNPNAKINLSARKQFNYCKPVNEEEALKESQALQEYKKATNYRAQKSRFWKKILDGTPLQKYMKENKKTEDQVIDDLIKNNKIGCTRNGNYYMVMEKQHKTIELVKPDSYVPPVNQVSVVLTSPMENIDVELTSSLKKLNDAMTESDSNNYFRAIYHFLISLNYENQLAEMETFTLYGKIKTFQTKYQGCIYSIPQIKELIKDLNLQN